MQEEKRTQFGQRFLTDKNLVFEHNAWDNVDWDEDQEKEALEKVFENSSIKASTEDQERYETNASGFWDDFYNQHENKFFKDRHWLFTEFPELAGKQTTTSPNLKDDEKLNKQNNVSNTETDKQITSTELLNNEDIKNLEGTESAAPYPGYKAATRVFEVGCGVGNTIFPILETNNDPDLFVYGCDLSSKAIDIIKDSTNYEADRCHVFTCDVSSPHPSFPFPPQSLDFIILIFVLSAIKPDKMNSTLKNLVTYLKPGGMLLFRDYGRYDMAQLRFKQGRCLEDNFYVRGDGTRVYFFTQEELRKMFEGLGLKEEQNYVDRRLQVNRGRQLKMFRVWVQCKYRLT